jgi:phage shock protein C
MITSSGTQGQIPQERRNSRLHRSAIDRVCCGVCGGIAEYLAVDASLVRLAFVVAAFWGGIGLLLYIVLAIILPVDNVAPSATPISSDRSRMTAGLVLLILGGLLLAGNMGLAPWLSSNLFWPGVLILIGVGLLLRNPHSTQGV